jgi:signal transduction histidine kinase
LLSVKAKQVAGVTSFVGVVVVVLTAVHLTWLMQLSLSETHARARMLAQTIYQQAFGVAQRAAGQPYEALRTDPGIRSILESGIYADNVAYAAIVDPSGIALVHSLPSEEGRSLAPQPRLAALQAAGPLRQLEAIRSPNIYEFTQDLLRGDQHFITIRIGVSTLLVRDALQQAVRQALQTALLALIVATIGALLLSQWMLRPIHVIKSGLTRLGRGELDVRLDLPAGDEFKELGSSFDAVSAQLAAMRTRAGSQVDLDSVVEILEDAVAVFGPEGRVLFANPAMRAMLPSIDPGRSLEEVVPAGHPVRTLVEQTFITRRGQGPASVMVPGTPEGQDDERLTMTHVIEEPGQGLVGAMLVSRNIDYLSRVQSTLAYSRKLAALGRLFAGVAHEVKNPLNAMTIHLELLKNKLTAARAGGPAAVMTHVDIIANEIRRLDQVMLGFLKFARPDELRLQPIQLPALISEVVQIVEPEARAAGVTIKVECQTDVPEIDGDPNMLQQALLNLAINACQAMPGGGTLRFVCRAAANRRVQLDVEDSGVGIQPEHLQKIFDLYFTTKASGSGIGLSMVYRIVQLHDGEIEVQSTPGRGTTFRMLLPQA